MNGPQGAARRGRSIRVPLACALLLLASGCIVVPLDQPTAGSRQNISEEAVAKFEKGVTTRQEVLLALGEPDWSSGDGDRLGYRWSRIRWLWVIAAATPSGAGGMAAGEISKEGYLQVTFDSDGRLLTSDITNSWSGNQSPEPIEQPPVQRPSGKVYVIDLQPRVHSPMIATADRPGVCVDVKEVVDRRSDPGRLGLFTSLGVKIGDIESSIGIPEFIRRELVAEVKAEGLSTGARDADITLEPSLTKFWVWTESTLFYFDVIAEVECDIAIARMSAPGELETRHYSGRQVERTWLIPGANFFSRIAGGSVDDLLAKIRADAPWDPAQVGVVASH